MLLIKTIWFIVTKENCVTDTGELQLSVTKRMCLQARTLNAGAKQV